MLAEIIAWDPKFDWVALGTLALALVTAYLGFSTRKAARAAEQANASAHRPILVPAGTPTWNQQAVKNVGTGPALNLAAQVTLDTPGRNIPPGDSLRPPASVVAEQDGAAPIGPGEHSTFKVGLANWAGGGAGSVPGDVFEWVYSDVAGVRYRTTARMTRSTGPPPVTFSWSEVTVGRDPA